MTEDEPNLNPAIVANLQTVSHVQQSHRMLRVESWEVKLDADRCFVEMFLGLVEQPEVYSHVLSIPAAKQLADHLQKAVEDYLDAHPDSQSFDS